MKTEEYLLCSHCAKDENLVQFITEQGTPGTCKLCLEKRDYTMTPKLAATVFKALVRYHYAEWAYNPKWGGDKLEQVLSQDNPIIDVSNIDKAEAADENFYFGNLIDAFTSPSWPYPNQSGNDGIWLYYGYDETGRSLYAESLQNKTSWLLYNLFDDLFKTNYFLLEEQWKGYLGECISHLAKTIHVGDQFYRGRIGMKDDAHKVESGFEATYTVFPYQGSDIGSAPQAIVKGGRLNRQNIAYLYLASDADTAVAELRPHPKHIVSLGRFAANQQIKVADLANVKFLPFAVNEKTLNTFVLLRSIERAFATPILPDESQTSGYLPTQFLADIIRQLGYDGVTFRSSVSEGGINLTVFNPATFSYVPGSADARRIASLRYIYGDVAVELEKDENELYM